MCTRECIPVSCAVVMSLTKNIYCSVETTATPHDANTHMNGPSCCAILPRNLATRCSEECKKCGRSTNISCRKSGIECGEVAGAGTRPRPRCRMYDAVLCRPGAQCFALMSVRAKKEVIVQQALYYRIVMDFHSYADYHVEVSKHRAKGCTCMVHIRACSFQGENLARQFWGLHFCGSY